MIAKLDNNLEIIAQLRDVSIPAKVLRNQGLVPIILYGKEVKPIPLSMTIALFTNLYKEAGETTIIDLKVEGTDKPHPVLIKELQLDPATDEYVHVDFYEIKAGEKLRATVPFVFEGEAPAVKEFGGILITNKNEVEVECLPKDLPKEIVVDVSGLEQIDDSIVVKDVKIPSGVEILDELEDSIVVITPPAEEEVEEEVVSEEDAVDAVEATGEKSETKEGEEAKEGEEKEDVAKDKESDKSDK